MFRFMENGDWFLGVSGVKQICELRAGRGVIRCLSRIKSTRPDLKNRSEP